jgi:hypothetical protein
VRSLPYLPKEATLPDKVVIEIHSIKPVLIIQKYLPFKDKKIGIVTNQSGIVLLEQSPIKSCG